MRGLFAAFAAAGAALLAPAVSAQADDEPKVEFTGFTADAPDNPGMHMVFALSASKAPFWSSGASIMSERIPGPDFSGRVRLDFANLAAGDLAGLALFHDTDHWLTIQVEPIAPATLIAVRLHDGPGGVTAGRLIYTTALSGSFAGKVRLRIDGSQGKARLMFAEEYGLWQILAEDVPLPFPAEARPELVLFATDGADPAPPRN